MNYSESHCEVEALFGSYARGDNDEISDRDYLLIDSDPVRLRAREIALTWSGWSVAAYTWTRFSKLVGARSLFVEHLKCDARILRDRDSSFQHALSQFYPRICYERPLSDSKKLIGLVERIPKSARGLGWASDVLAVGFRNASLQELANRGIYVFSHKEIVNQLIRVGILQRSDAPYLDTLRKWKAQYRHKANCTASFQDFVNVLRRIDGALKIGMHTQQLCPDQFSGGRFSDCLGSYSRMRSIERELTCYSSGNIDPQKFNVALKALGVCLVQPRTYFWKFSGNNDAVIQNLMQIRKLGVVADGRSIN